MDLRPEHLNLVRAILREHTSGVEVRAFGSRVTQSAKKHSDLDLVLMGRAEIDQKVLIRLRFAFKESDLPFRVDLVDWSVITPEFRRIIERDYEVV